MFVSIFIGILAAATVTLAMAVFSRAPTRSLCPECGDPTNIVLLPPVLRRNEFVHMRWCPTCEWEGLGRNGPEWVPGRKVAHDSGFHWGAKGFQPDFGFQFRPNQQVNEKPPHHVSGFRFSADPTPTLPAAPHPSGFRFAGNAEPNTRAVFRWAEEPTADGFEFKNPVRPRGSSRDGGFHWKGVA